MRKKNCSGCGAKFQSEHEDQIGYIQDSAWEENNNPICQRCFKLKYYSQNILIQNNRSETFKEVGKAIKQSEIVLFVADIFDLEVGFDSELLDILKKKRVILVVTKVDLLKIHASKIAAWAKDRVKQYKLRIIDVALVSNVSNYGINGVMRKIEKFYEKEITMSVIGVSNSGKSSFIHNVLGGQSGLTISKFSGTTLKNISKKTDINDYSIIDTPGIIAYDRVIEHVCSNCMVNLIPTKLKLTDLKVKAGQILCLGGLAKITVEAEEKETKVFEFAASPAIKTAIFSEKNRDKIEIDYVPEKISPPCEVCKKRYFVLDKKTETFDLKKGEELYIAGLGWLYAKYHDAKISIEIAENIKLVQRKSLLKLMKIKNIKKK